MSHFEKLKLLDIDRKLFDKKMRDAFKELIDTYAEGPAGGYLQSVPSNYGYVFFWYGWLDSDALEKYYSNYVDTNKLKEIEEARKEDEFFDLKDHIDDILFTLVRDHPDVIGGGHAEAHLAMLMPRLKKVTIQEGTKSLRDYAERLEKLDKYYSRRIRSKAKGLDDIESSFEIIEFLNLNEVDGDHSPDDVHKRMGHEIQARLDFDGDDKLGKVIDELDVAIAPLKPLIDPMFRFGDSYYPF